MLIEACPINEDRKEAIYDSLIEKLTEQSDSQKQRAIKWSRVPINNKNIKNKHWKMSSGRAMRYIIIIIKRLNIKSHSKVLILLYSLLKI